MKTRIIYTKFWQDNYISTLNCKEKLAFIYFFSNIEVNLCGIYELPNKRIGFDLDFSQKELDEIEAKFQKDNKFLFFEGWVKIVNIDKYNNFTGEKNEIAKTKELALISDRVLDHFNRVSMGYLTIADSPNNQKSEILINNQKSEDKKKNKKSIYTRNFFLKEKDNILLEAKEKYPTKNAEKCMENFINKTEAKDYGYSNYKLGYFNWLREDKFNEYGSEKKINNIF